MNDLNFATPHWLATLHTWLAPYSAWREVSLGGAYVPTLLLLFVACAGLTWLCDLAIARLGVYRMIWHPPLFRVSLFVCLLSVFGIALYG